MDADDIYTNQKSVIHSKKLMQQEPTDTKARESSVPARRTCWILAVLVSLVTAGAATAAVILIKNKTCTSPSCPSCPSQWVGYHGSCYYFSKEKKSWASSRQFCSAQKARLLVISGFWEMEFFQMIAAETHWIGLKRNTSSYWLWEDETDFNTPKVFMNSQTQNCGALLKSGIQGSSCEVALPWICEKCPE